MHKTATIVITMIIKSMSFYIMKFEIYNKYNKSHKSIKKNNLEQWFSTDNTYTIDGTSEAAN